MFVGKGKGENRILKEFVWRIIFKIFFPKYLVVRRTTRSQLLVVLTQFLVVKDTRTREFCYPVRIDKSDRSVNCTAPINEVWMGCSQRTYCILHMIRQLNIIPIC